LPLACEATKKEHPSGTHRKQVTAVRSICLSSLKSFELGISFCCGSINWIWPAENPISNKQEDWEEFSLLKA